MALTEYEKKILEQMEASLREEDPALASQMSAPVSEEPESKAAEGPRAPRRIALGLTGAVLGMIVLVAAVSLGVLRRVDSPGGRRFRCDGSRSALRVLEAFCSGARRR